MEPSLDEQRVRDELRAFGPTSRWNEIYDIAKKHAEQCYEGKWTEEYSLVLIRQSAASPHNEFAAIRLADFYVQENFHASAMEQLAWVVESGQDGYWVAQARYQLAILHFTHGDESKMLHYLELAAAAPPVSTNRGLMDTSDTQQAALRLLGERYLAKGEPGKAIEYFTRWQPHSWCGTCTDQLKREREVCIAECRRQLGEPVYPQSEDRVVWPTAKIQDFALVLLALFSAYSFVKTTTADRASMPSAR